MEVQLTYTSFHMQIYSQNRGNEFTGAGMAAKENSGECDCSSSILRLPGICISFTWHFFYILLSSASLSSKSLYI